MWNDHSQQSGGYNAPPSFPTFPSASEYSMPNMPEHAGYNPSYGTSYGPPPTAPQGYGAPPGPPHPGYGMPQGYPPPPGPPPSGYAPPPGPPGGPPSNYAPPPGPPPFGSPAGAPPIPSRGYPGQAYHQQQGQQGQQQGQYHASYPSTPQGGYPTQYTPPQIPPNRPYAPPSGPPPRPPTTQQNYGPHFEGPNHRDAQPFFQYSQCTGKKKALCIGINYFKQNGELRGCINDVKNITGFITQNFGYKREDIVTLTDDATNPRQLPTKANIIEAMRWLVRGAAPNDSLFFHYSGHGGQTKDTDGDEGDGFDEVIYPVDFQKAGHIVDDLMHDIMVKPLPAGCRLTAIFDSCHSGSALDLPYIYSTEGKVKEPNLAAEAGQGLLSAVSSYARGDMSGVFKSAMGIVKTATGSTQKAEKHAKATRTSPADVISWSGCKDSQTSADTSEAGKATGAMSFAFIQALGQNKQQSYQQLLVNLRAILKAKYSQKPQLSSSHPMDTSIMFIC